VPQIFIVDKLTYVAECTFPSLSTDTLVRADHVYTGTTILTRVAGTVIDICKVKVTKGKWLRSDSNVLFQWYWCMYFKELKQVHLIITK